MVQKTNAEKQKFTTSTRERERERERERAREWELITNNLNVKCKIWRNNIGKKVAKYYKWQIERERKVKTMQKETNPCGRNELQNTQNSEHDTD